MRDVRKAAAIRTNARGLLESVEHLLDLYERMFEMGTFPSEKTEAAWRELKRRARQSRGVIDG